MNLDELLKEAKSGNMAAQYDLAEYYGKLLKETQDEDEIYNYSKQAMIWLRKSSKQGYKPAVEAVNELSRVSVPTPDSDPGNTPAPAPAVKSAPIKSEPKPVETAAEKHEPEPITVRRERPAAESLPSSDTVVMEAIPDRPKKETIRPVDEKPQKERYFDSTTHIVVVCMLIVSLLINVFLLYFLFRVVKTGGILNIGVSASASPTLTPESTPTSTSQMTPASSDEPSPSPTSEVKGSWLDLSKYKNLKVLPGKIYDDYKYYTVIATDTLNMRAGPGTDYDKIDTIPSKTKVGAVADSNGWYLVYYNSNFGWVKSEFISDDPNAAPSFTATPKKTEGSSGNLKTF